MRGWLLGATLVLTGCANIASPAILTTDIYEYRDFELGDTLTFHWPRADLPVRVWVAPDSPIKADVTTAITRWEHAFFYGEFRATVVTDSNAADIIVRNTPSDQSGTTLRAPLNARASQCDGQTDLDIDPDAKTLTLPIHIYMYAVVSESVPGIPQCFSITMTHEIGHAIGIIAHSPHSEDVMFPNPVFDGISDRDRLTAVVLYQTIPTLTFVGRR